MTTEQVRLGEIRVTTQSDIPVFSFQTFIFEEFPASILQPAAPQLEPYRARRFKQGDCIGVPTSRVQALLDWLHAACVHEI